jgi:hypothetical protein
MRVQELIDELKNHDPDAIVYKSYWVRERDHADHEDCSDIDWIREQTEPGPDGECQKVVVL